MAVTITAFVAVKIDNFSLVIVAYTSESGNNRLGTVSYCKKHYIAPNC